MDDQKINRNYIIFAYIYSKIYIFAYTLFIKNKSLKNRKINKFLTFAKLHLSRYYDAFHDGKKTRKSERIGMNKEKNFVELSLKTLLRLHQFEATKAPSNKGLATIEASR